MTSGVLLRAFYNGGLLVWGGAFSSWNVLTIILDSTHNDVVVVVVVVVVVAGIDAVRPLYVVESVARTPLVVNSPLVPRDLFLRRRDASSSPLQHGVLLADQSTQLNHFRCLVVGGAQLQALPAAAAAVPEIVRGRH